MISRVTGRTARPIEPATDRRDGLAGGHHPEPGGEQGQNCEGERGFTHGLTFPAAYPRFV